MRVAGIAPWVKIGDKPLKGLDRAEGSADLDFVPPGLDFVPPDFDFVPTGFDFLPTDFEFLPRVLEVGTSAARGLRR